MGEPNLTVDHEIYYENALAKTLELYATNKTGFLSTFPFGAFAYARLDERLADSSLWKDASLSGHDHMGLTPQQPNVEFFNSECYLGLSQRHTDYPKDGESAFMMLTELFSQRSRGTVQLRSADPTENPVVNHNYLNDELDLLVLAEGCRLANEIVMHGSGTKDVVTGAWPAGAQHHEFTTREQWMKFVRDGATTCKFLHSCILPFAPTLPSLGTDDSRPFPRLSSCRHMQDGQRRRSFRRGGRQAPRSRRLGPKSRGCKCDADAQQRASADGGLCDWGEGCGYDQSRSEVELSECFGCREGYLWSVRWLYFTGVRFPQDE